MGVGAVLCTQGAAGRIGGRYARVVVSRRGVARAVRAAFFALFVVGAVHLVVNVAATAGCFYALPSVANGIQTLAARAIPIRLAKFVCGTVLSVFGYAVPQGDFFLFESKLFRARLWHNHAPFGFVEAEETTVYAPGRAFLAHGRVARFSNLCGSHYVRVAFDVVTNRLSVAVRFVRVPQHGDGFRPNGTLFALWPFQISPCVSVTASRLV